MAKEYIIYGERNILCMTRSTGITTEVEQWSLHCESVLEDMYFI